jgi:hypothetical protein
MQSCQGRAARTALLASVAALALSACNGGPASAPPSGHAQGGDTRVASAGYSNAYASGAGYAGAQSASTGGDRPDPRREPIPLVEGKPMWAANRLHTAQENAQYQFERDGADFGARSVDDFVAKAHAFVDKPPADVLTLTRTNGDRLFYDAHGNVFAVATKDGAPRAMFKPRDGAAYWDEQKERAAEAAQDDRGGSNGGGERRYTSGRSSGSTASDDQG